MDRNIRDSIWNVFIKTDVKTCRLLYGFTEYTHNRIVIYKENARNFHRYVEFTNATITQSQIRVLCFGYFVFVILSNHGKQYAQFMAFAHSCVFPAGDYLLYVPSNLMSI